MAKYLDTDAGLDANDGTTWALGNLTMEGLLADMAAGEDGFAQGAADDTAASIRTYTSPGTVTNPCKIVACVNGTTNEGASIVTSDLASTRVTITVTGAGNDMSFAGSAKYVGFHFTAVDRWTAAAASFQEFEDCKITYGGRCLLSSAKVILNNCDLEPTGTGGQLDQTNGVFIMNGGAFIGTAPTVNLLRSSNSSDVEFNGVDFSALTGAIVQGGAPNCRVTLRNCLFHASTSLTSAALSAPTAFVHAIGCTTETSVTNSSSIQMNTMVTAFGTSEIETTIVRTSGSSDGAKGLFAYKLTANADATRESTSAAVVSQWVRGWVDGGSAVTLTMYICNDSASTDYLEDEVRGEFFTPDVGDTAQYDHTYDSADEYNLISATAVAVDTGSEWGTGGNNHQKFSATLTPGYSGPIYGRVYLSKRQASPDSLYLDGVIEVT